MQDKEGSDSDWHLNELSRQEQREAAFNEACRILEDETDHFIIICRVGNGKYLRHVNGNSHAERFSLATGAAVHLIGIISDLAVCAAERADLEDEEESGK